MPPDAREPCQHRLFEAGLAAGGLDAVRVPLGVLEAERVLGGEPRLALLEGALVHDRGDALARADAEGVAALGADAARAIDFRAGDDFLAGCFKFFLIPPPSD